MGSSMNNDNAILKEVKDHRKDHIWAGDEGRFKWVDLQLDEDKEKLEISNLNTQEIHFTAISDGEDSSFFKCDYCDGVWDTVSYPKLIKEPFEHIRCPCCDKIIAMAYEEEPKEVNYDRIR
jgi:hypothetical protein